MRRNRLSLPSDLHLVGGEDASVHLTMGYLYDTFRLPFYSNRVCWLFMLERWMDKVNGEWFSISLRFAEGIVTTMDLQQASRPAQRASRPSFRDSGLHRRASVY